MAAFGARKPRPADVVGGYAVLVGLVVLAAYITVLAINPPQ